MEMNDKTNAKCNNIFQVQLDKQKLYLVFNCMQKLVTKKSNLMANYQQQMKRKKNELSSSHCSYHFGWFHSAYS